MIHSNHMISLLPTYYVIDNLVHISSWINNEYSLVEVKCLWSTMTSSNKVDRRPGQDHLAAITRGRRPPRGGACLSLDIFSCTPFIVNHNHNTSPIEDETSLGWFDVRTKIRRRLFASPSLKQVFLAQFGLYWHRIFSFYHRFNSSRWTQNSSSFLEDSKH